MPLPIWPEPITPIFLIIAAILSSHRAKARFPRLPVPLLHKHRPESASSDGAFFFSSQLRAF
jgi:hypothetical protein